MKKIVLLICLMLVFTLSLGWVVYAEEYASSGNVTTEDLTTPDVITCDYNVNGGPGAPIDDPL